MHIYDLIGETTEYDKKEMLEEKKPKSWCKSVSAFANGIGGTLIFGIAKDDTVIGLERAEHDAEIISEQIKARLDPIPNFKLSFHHTKEGKKLILLNIYPGDETPYYYEGDGMKVAYHRVGNESVPADRAKLKELVLKGSATSYDSLKSKYIFEDMAFTKLKSTYKARTGDIFEDSDYESFGIIDDSGNLTNAGALLADDSPIRHSRLFCTRWNGLDKAPGIIDAIDDKEFSGGLINLLQNGTEFVTNNSKKAWAKVKDGRIEMPDYPERAVLEGIVNALIHRNYLEVGSEVHIDMFDDRLEIYSPGGMIDGSRVQDRDLMNIPSRRRNPIIADIFNRLKYMDRRGSGFKKILGDYKFQLNYTEHQIPQFFSDNESFLLILKNLNYKNERENVNFAQENELSLSEVLGQVLTKKDYNKVLPLIEYFEKSDSITPKQAKKIIGKSTATIRRYLNILVEADIVKIEGSTNNVIYKIK